VDRNTALLIPNGEMLGERNPDVSWRRRYVSLLSFLARRLSDQGWTPRVMNHEGAADAALCESLREATGGRDVIYETDPRALKGIIGSAGIVVCSRYHGCVSALAQGVPCLGTAWSHKYAALFNEFGAGEDLLAVCDESAAAVALDRVLGAREATSARLAAARPAVEAQIESMWRRVFDVLRAVRTK
jgi:colanic acid/amylovoran biosynthesis protein